MINTDFIKIPYQLENELFIVLEPKSKEPKRGWRWTEHKLPAEKIEKWINQMGYNYGVTYSTDLAVMDADDAGKLSDLHISDILTDTYTVKSGRTDSTGKHIYFRLTGEIPKEYQHLRGKKILLQEPETKANLGDIRTPGSNFYNVAPYSIHPSSRKPYLPIDESADIIRLSYAELFETLDELQQLPPRPNTAEEYAQQNPEPKRRQSFGMLDYGFTVLDFLAPINPHQTPTGEMEGTHPIHGSTTGHNLTVTADGSKWYCRRCGTGGGWLKALAVSRGIIDCSEANRALSKDEYLQILQILRDLKPEVYEHNWLQFRRERTAARMKRYANNRQTPAKGDKTA